MRKFWNIFYDKNSFSKLDMKCVEMFFFMNNKSENNVFSKTVENLI